MDDLISRQAAIDALERIFNQCEEIEAHLPDGDPDKTGYKMFPDYMTVWKYLRQLPPAINDLISRRAAIYAFRKELCRERVYATPFISFKGCERILNELPSAERHGRWDNGFCSVCGAEALTEWNDTGGEYAFTKFCPNCGAKMNEVSKDE